MKRHSGTLLLAALVLLALAPGRAAALWPQRGGGGNDDAALAVATGVSGSAYAVGSFRGTGSFGSLSAVSAGDEDIFIVKYDVAGNPVWMRRAGGVSADRATAVAVDANENIYVTGFFNGTANFGGFTLSAYDDGVADDRGSDIFVVKIDKDGNWKWARRAGQRGLDEAYAITFLPGESGGVPPQPGSVIIGGRYICETKFENLIPASGPPAVANGDLGAVGSGCPAPPKSELFVALIQDDGTWKWAKDAHNGNTSDEWVDSLTVDQLGQIFLSGPYWAATSFHEGASTVASLTSTSAGANWDAPSAQGWRLVTDHYHSAGQAYWVPDPVGITDFALAQRNSVDVSAATHPVLEFYQRYKFDWPGTCYDVGVLERSTDGGGSWADINNGAGSSRFIAGGYTGTQNGYESNPLSGRQGWCETMPNFFSDPNYFGRVAVNLSDFKTGSGTVKLRWRIGTGTAVSDQGWWVDDVTIFDDTNSNGVRDGGEPILFQDDMEARPNYFLAKISNATAEPVNPVWSWAQSVPDSPVANGPSVSIADLATVGDRLYVAGTVNKCALTGTCAPLGGGSPGVSLTAAGAFVGWLRDGFGGASWQGAEQAVGGTATGLALDSSDDLFLTGYFGAAAGDTVTFGSLPAMQSAGKLGCVRGPRRAG